MFAKVQWLSRQRGCGLGVNFLRRCCRWRACGPPSCSSSSESPAGSIYWTLKQDNMSINKSTLHIFYNGKCVILELKEGMVYLVLLLSTLQWFNCLCVNIVEIWKVYLYWFVFNRQNTVEMLLIVSRTKITDRAVSYHNSGLDMITWNSCNDKAFLSCDLIN